MTPDRIGTIISKKDLAEKFGVDLSVINKLHEVGILRREEYPGSGRTKGYPVSQEWKVEEALKRKEKTPDASWKEIAKNFPTSRLSLGEES